MGEKHSGWREVRLQRPRDEHVCSAKAPREWGGHWGQRGDQEAEQWGGGGGVAREGAGGQITGLPIATW